MKPSLSLIFLALCNLPLSAAVFYVDRTDDPILPGLDVSPDSPLLFPQDTPFGWIDLDQDGVDDLGFLSSFSLIQPPVEGYSAPTYLRFTGTSEFQQIRTWPAQSSEDFQLPFGLAIGPTLEPPNSASDPGSTLTVGWSGGFFDNPESIFSEDQSVGYIGFAWARETGLHYGWIRIERRELLESPEGDPVLFFPAGSGFAVTGWAFETEANQSIRVGVIPEPGVLPLLGFGLGLVLLARRQRA